MLLSFAPFTVLFCLCLFDPPFFVVVYSWVVTSGVHGSPNIFSFLYQHPHPPPVLSILIFIFTKRGPGWSAGCSVCRAPGVDAECTSRLAAFARTTPMADDRHTSMAFVTPRVASKCDLLPHPPAFQPHFHPCQTGLHPVLHTLQNPSIWTAVFLLTIASASQLANHIVSQHTTTHRAFSTWPGLVLLMSACLPSFALVHSLVAICWRAWVI